MKTLALILLIAANSLLAAQTPPTDLPTPDLPTPAPTRTYSGGIVGVGGSNCQRNGQGPVIKHSPGRIITIHASGVVQSDFWLLLFNKTTAPLHLDVPAIAIPFTQVNHVNDTDRFNGSADRDYPGGLPMTIGISWALSSSPSVLAPPDCFPLTLTVTYQ